MAKFSICIPNFNYANYISETICSVLDQSYRDLEVLVADNASTDTSVTVIRSLQARDERIHLRVNNCNVGFAGNLNKSASMATGKWMTMLSSDDLMSPDALSDYAAILEALGLESETTILSSAVDVIDGESIKTGQMSLDWKQWSGAEKDAKLSSLINADVWVMPAKQLLRNSLNYCRTPFHFATTTYSKKMYDAVEGYCQGAVINPDKRFAWAILGEATKAVFIDKPLFAYRVHSNNQGAQQAKSGALKHITDEYVATFAVTDELLSKAGLNRDGFVDAFIEQDIALRGLLALSESNRNMAFRIFRFGQATYPSKIYKNRKVWALWALLLLGPIGIILAAQMKARVLASWQRKNQPVVGA